MAKKSRGRTPLTLGQRMKAARQAAGLRQIDVALACNVGSMAVSCWERGVNVPRLRYAQALASLLADEEVATLIVRANAAREPAAA